MITIGHVKLSKVPAKLGAFGPKNEENFENFQENVEIF